MFSSMVVFKYQNLLLSRDLGAMLYPFEGAMGRIHPL